jgi:hypothetical protein
MAAQKFFEDLLQTCQFPQLYDTQDSQRFQQQPSLALHFHVAGMTQLEYILLIGQTDIQQQQ